MPSKCPFTQQAGGGAGDGNKVVEGRNVVFRRIVSNQFSPTPPEIVISPVIGRVNAQRVK